MRAAFVEWSTGEILLGPPKSRAGRRVIGIPAAIIPDLREHLSIFVKPDAGALVFTGAKGGPMRRSNFNKMSAWPHGVSSIGAAGLHVHDLRHTGNTFAASGGWGISSPTSPRALRSCQSLGRGARPGPCHRLGLDSADSVQTIEPLGGRAADIFAVLQSFHVLVPGQFHADAQAELFSERLTDDGGIYVQPRSAG